MEQIYLINVEFQETRVALLEHGFLKSYYVERSIDKGIFGNVYKGKVETVIQGMQAAFVNIGLNFNGFLHVSGITDRVNEYDDVVENTSENISGKTKNVKSDTNINQLLKPGQEILVQVIREPISSKGPRLTTHISLPGRHLVLMPFDEQIGISKRIENPKKRKFLREIADKLKLPKGMGLIFRTTAEDVDRREIIFEYKYLLKLWNNLDKKAKVSSAPCLIHEEKDLTLRVIRDMLSNKVEKVLIDSKQEYKKMIHFTKKFAREFKRKVRYYKSDIPIFEKYNVHKEIERIYERKVELKSGGCIIIESTESLVSIDVNSGGYVGKKDLESTAFFVNMEAAEEIIRQIKLRDLGGIIIVDFIDMNKRDHVKKLLDKVGQLLKSDKSESDFWFSPKAGLVEMTRQRSRKSIRSISYQECPYCNGRGVVRSPITIALGVIREINNKLPVLKTRRVCIKINPEIADVLSSKFKSVLDHLKRKNKIEIVFKKDSNCHIEKIEFIN